MTTRVEPYLGRVQDAPGTPTDLTQNVVVVGVAGDVNTRVEPYLGRVYDAPGSPYDGMQVVTTVDEGGEPTLGADFDVDLLDAAGALAAGDQLLVSQGGTEKKVALSAVKTFTQDIDTLAAVAALTTADLLALSQAGTEKKLTLETLRSFVHSFAGTLVGAYSASGLLLEVNNSINKQDCALLELISTTQGFLLPRMDETARDVLASPVAGLMIYNTTSNKLNFYNGTTWEAVTSA